MKRTICLLVLFAAGFARASDFAGDATNIDSFLIHGGLPETMRAVRDLRLDVRTLQAANTGSTSGTNTGDVTIGAVGSATANGASLSGQVLSLTPADATHPGLVTTGTQSMAGAKTFSTSVGTPALTTSATTGNPAVTIVDGSKVCLDGATCTHAVTSTTFSGTNSGDVTLAAVGSTPSANGASLATQVLTLQPADASHPGVMTAAAQTFGGVKTFAGVVPGTTSLSTCGTSIAEGTVSAQGGGTGGTRTKLCLCTSNGAGTPSYAWENVTGVFATQAASIGTATACPDPT